MTIQRLYTIDEVGTVAHAPRGSVLFWIYSGKLASVKAGRRRLVTEDALRRFLGLDGPKGDGGEAVGRGRVNDREDPEKSDRDERERAA